MYNDTTKTGYVYILTNPSFREDWVKIGKSSRPVDIRSKELDNTAVPLPFEIYAVMKTEKYNEVEKLVHKSIERFAPLRIRSNREFFNIKPEKALLIFKDIAEAIDDAQITVYEDKEKQLTQTSYSSTGRQNNGKKRPKFSINGIGNFCKQRVAFEVIKKHIQSSHSKYSAIEKELSDKDLQNWIRPKYQVPAENPNDTKWNSRWFDESLISSDGVEFLVSRQIGSGCPIDFNNICRISEKWGYKIEMIQ